MHLECPHMYVYLKQTPSNESGCLKENKNSTHIKHSSTNSLGNAKYVNHGKTTRNMKAVRASLQSLGLTKKYSSLTAR